MSSMRGLRLGIMVYLPLSAGWLLSGVQPVPSGSARCAPTRASYEEEASWPSYDYESAGDFNKAKYMKNQVVVNKPGNKAWEAPTALDSLDSAIRSLDYSRSSDEYVASCAQLIWDSLMQEGVVLEGSPLSAAFGREYILAHNSLPMAMGSFIAEKTWPTLPPTHELRVSLSASLSEIYARPEVLRGLVSDLAKAYIVDPAAEGMLQLAYYFKGYHAMTMFRAAHVLWTSGGTAEKSAALLLQSRASELFGVDIHPGAQIGNGVMLDHATGVVIGGTAIIGDDIYMLHQVTLGATGKPTNGAKRHPTVGARCTLGAGCKVLGDVAIGDGATVGAAAVVTRDVPAGGTVIGVNKLMIRKGAPGDDYTWFYDV